MTIISLITAMTQSRVIGIKNKIPWNIPEELQYFKQITMGKPMIMGRKTFDSLGQKALPGRRSIIVTRNTTIENPSVTVANSLGEAINAAGDVEEIMIIGGAAIYKQALPYAHKLYLSCIHQDYEGDTYFPDYNPEDWTLNTTSQHPSFTAYQYERLTPSLCL